MGTKCHYQTPCQQISSIPLRMWPNLPPRTGTPPPLKSCCTTALKIFVTLMWIFFPRCPPSPSRNRVKSPADPTCLHSGQVKSNTQKPRAGRERRGSTGRQGALHELQSLSGQLLLLPSEKSLQKGQGLVFSFVEGITKCKSFC